MPNRQTFVRGAMLLAGAAMVSKILGSVYTIVLQNIIGDDGMGLFQMAYPVYATLLAVATAGFPVAISKLVSERLAQDDEAGAKRIFGVSSVLLTVFGVAAFAALFFGASHWANLAGDPRAEWAMRAIAPALLVVPWVSAVRGYFQGYQWMQPTATSQVAEQAVRVGTILVLAILLTRAGYGAGLTAAGAAFGAVTGAIGAFLVLGYYWHRRTWLQISSEPDANRKRQPVVRQLLVTAFPISLGALVVPLMNNVDVVTVVNLLKGTGMSQQLATANFGLLTARAFKLMMLPTTLAAGIGIAVMPAVSEAFTRGLRGLLVDRIHLSVRLTAMLALPASIGLAILAEPINIALFQNNLGTTAIRVLAFATLFASLQTTAAAVLQGSGRMYLPVFHLVVAGGAKLALNLLWVPKFGIVGAASATVVSYSIAAVLNMAAVQRHVGGGLPWVQWLARPLVATIVMGGFVFAAFAQWQRLGGFHHGRLAQAGFVVADCALGMTVYLFALMASGALHADELASVPRIGPRLTSLFTRIGLLR